MDTRYRYFDRGHRWLFGVLIRCGTIVEKFDGEKWIFVDIIAPDCRLVEQ